MNEVHVNWKCNIIIVHHCAVCNSISCSSFTMMDMDLGVVASATTNWHPSNTPRSVYKTHGSIYLWHRAYIYMYFLCLCNTATCPLGMVLVTMPSNAMAHEEEEGTEPYFHAVRNTPVNFSFRLGLVAFSIASSV